MGSNLQIQLGKRIRSLREAAGISQEAFAAQANIDRAAYGKLERGEINLTLLTLARIAISLEAELAELFEDIQINADEIRATPRKRSRATHRTASTLE
ncbi:MAG: helix-turn-helix transcriptional regulator [Novosphingobium sp.]|nr:helix-turn-helix transcriptional regulator [Novosphingobium sp.]